MANAAFVLDNMALSGNVAASSQVLTMPVSKLLTPHPSERWRSLSDVDYFVLDNGGSITADTVMIGGLTCSEDATVRLRLSSIDATGVAGDVLDTGVVANGDPGFDVDYRSFVAVLDVPLDWRYLRFDISDAGADYVEAGFVLEGLREEMAVNFAQGGSVQYVDRSRVSKSSSGLSLVWQDNQFRRVDLSFPWVEESQRYGLIERLDRVCGRRSNVLLITEPDAANLPRVSFYGLMTDVTPVTFGIIFDLYGKQLRMEERI
ncbi:hypothetical protein ABH973_006693 [Bradyrhizobium ottawaense]|uniref:hypothetical protein n=1 Tax=Bradyrhizobium ottawaense TaxID=931866 RepID=UPI003515AB0D